MIATSWAPRGAKSHLDPFLGGIPARDVREGVDVEVGVELAVEHAQDVAIELGGDAGAVVVRGNEPSDILDEVGTEQQ